MELICAKKYAASCDAVYCDRYGCGGKILQWSIFLNGDLIHKWARLMQGRDFKIRFVIHNSDKSFDVAELSALLPFAKSIRAANCIVEHPIVEPIPLGVSDKQYDFINDHPELKPLKQKGIFIYANFLVGTNIKERAQCLDAKIKNVTYRSGLSQSEYYHNICNSKYVLCPEGTGLDTHRVYEALHFGAIPIVKRNPLAKMYEKIGGILIVDRWEDCNNLE